MPLAGRGTAVTLPSPGLSLPITAHSARHIRLDNGNETEFGPHTTLGSADDPPSARHGRSHRLDMLPRAGST